MAGLDPHRPYAVPAASRDNRHNTAVALLAIFLLSILISSAAALVRWFSATCAGGSAVSDKYLALLSAHRYTAASKLLLPSLRTKDAPAKLRNMEDFIENTYGPVVRYGTSQTYLRRVDGETLVHCVYAAKFAKRSHAVSTVVIKTDTGYFLWEYTVNTQP